MNTTANLLSYLENADRAALFRYRETQLKGRVTDYRAYMDRLIEKSGRSRIELCRIADIRENYGYKLLSGEIQSGDRDRLIRILFALRATLAECQRALKLHTTAVLSPHSYRDAILIYALYHRIYDLELVNEWLLKEGEKPLL